MPFIPFDHDALTGVTTSLVDNDGVMVLKYTQDVEPIIEQNRAIQNSGHSMYSPSKDMRHVASIPVSLVDDLIRKGIWDDEKKFRAWLNDPDNRVFRTGLGAV